MSTTTEAPKTRYNLPVIAHVRDMIAEETNHQQNIWTIVDRSTLQKIVERFRPKGSRKEYVPVSCPTAACVAGWTAIVTGGKMLVPVEVANGGDARVDSAEMVDTKGVVRDISQYARQTLGLTSDEADHLFAAHWSNGQVLDHLDNIMAAGESGTTWPRQPVRRSDDEDDD